MLTQIFLFNIFLVMTITPYSVTTFIIFLILISPQVLIYYFLFFSQTVLTKFKETVDNVNPITGTNELNHILLFLFIK